MGLPAPKPVPLAVSALLFALLACGPAPAQTKMTPEEEAIYRNMVKGMGWSYWTA